MRYVRSVPSLLFILLCITFVPQTAHAEYYWSRGYTEYLLRRAAQYDEMIERALSRLPPGPAYDRLARLLYSRWYRDGRVYGYYNPWNRFPNWQKNSSVTLTSLGGVTSPQIRPEGKGEPEKLWATDVHVWLASSGPYFAYALVGYAGRGGVGGFNVVGFYNVTNPVPVVLVTSLFTDFRAFAVTRAPNGEILLAGNSLIYGACFRRFVFRYPTNLNDRTNLVAAVRDHVIPTAGFAAVSIVADPKQVVVASGDNAGVSVFEYPNMNQKAYWKIPNARAVAMDGSTPWVASGQPGMLYPMDGRQSNPYKMGGAMTPESKSTLQIFGNLAVASLGEAGWASFCTKSGRRIGGAPPLSSSLDYVINAVTRHGRDVFAAAGAGGVYHYWETDSALNRDGCPNGMSLQNLGGISVNGAGASANDVFYQPILENAVAKLGILFLAEGRGGLAMVGVDQRTPYNPYHWYDYNRYYDWFRRSR